MTVLVKVTSLRYSYLVYIVIRIKCQVSYLCPFYRVVVSQNVFLILDKTNLCHAYA